MKILDLRPHLPKRPPPWSFPVQEGEMTLDEMRERLIDTLPKGHGWDIRVERHWLRCLASEREIRQLYEGTWGDEG